MAIPLTLEEQKSSKNFFNPKKKIGLYVGISNYDKVARQLDGVQYPVEKIIHVEKGVEDFKACMEKYLFKKSDSVCLVDPSSKDINAQTNLIIKALRTGKQANPATLTLIVAFFAGLGINYEGMQWLV